jgi:PAB1-binding protein PBP1
MRKLRRVLGILLVIAGPVVAGVGYLTAPSASSCTMANSIAFELGQPETCSPTPSALYFAAGAVLLVVGVMIMMPWDRWLTGAN